MQSPSYHDVHNEAILADISIKYSNGDFVIGRIFPEIQVKKQADKYYKFGKESLIRYDTRREPGTSPRTIYHSLTTDTYYCDGRALGQAVTDEERDNADTPIDPEVDATENVTDSLMLDYEMRGLEIIDAAITSVASPGTKWDSIGGGTPDADVLGGVIEVHKKILRMPNLMVIPFEVAVRLTTNPVIKEMTKYTMNLLTIGSAILLPNPLWGMEVLIPGCGYNSSELNQAESLNYVWGDNVYLFYVNKNPGRKKISFGYSFRWKQREIRKTRDERPKVTYIDIEEWLDIKLTCTDAAIKIPNVLST